MRGENSAPCSPHELRHREVAGQGALAGTIRVRGCGRRAVYRDRRADGHIADIGDGVIASRSMLAEWPAQGSTAGLVN